MCDIVATRKLRGGPLNHSHDTSAHICQTSLLLGLELKQKLLPLSRGSPSRSVHSF